MLLVLSRKSGTYFVLDNCVAVKSSVLLLKCSYRGVGGAVGAQSNLVLVMLCRLFFFFRRGLVNHHLRQILFVHEIATPKTLLASSQSWKWWWWLNILFELGGKGKWMWPPMSRRPRARTNSCARCTRASCCPGAQLWAFFFFLSWKFRRHHCKQSRGHFSWDLGSFSPITRLGWTFQKQGGNGNLGRCVCLKMKAHLYLFLTMHSAKLLHVPSFCWK